MSTTIMTPSNVNPFSERGIISASPMALSSEIPTLGQQPISGYQSSPTYSYAIPTSSVVQPTTATLPPGLITQRASQTYASTPVLLPSPQNQMLTTQPSMITTQPNLVPFMGGTTMSRPMISAPTTAFHLIGGQVFNGKVHLYSDHDMPVTDLLITLIGTERVNYVRHKSGLFGRKAAGSRQATTTTGTMTPTGTTLGAVDGMGNPAFPEAVTTYKDIIAKIPFSGQVFTMGSHEATFSYDVPLNFPASYDIFRDTSVRNETWEAKVDYVMEVCVTHHHNILSREIIPVKVFQLALPKSEYKGAVSIAQTLNKRKVTATATLQSNVVAFGKPLVLALSVENLGKRGSVGNFMAYFHRHTFLQANESSREKLTRRNETITWVKRRKDFRERIGEIFIKEGPVLPGERRNFEVVIPVPQDIGFSIQGSNIACEYMLEIVSDFSSDFSFRFPIVVIGPI